MPQLSPTLGFMFFALVLTSFLILTMKMRENEARASSKTFSSKSFKKWMF